MGRSTEYYRTHPEARKKKAETDKKINARPEGLKYKSRSANRGSKPDTAGDRNARG